MREHLYVRSDWCGAFFWFAVSYLLFGLHILRNLQPVYVVVPMIPLALGFACTIASPRRYRFNGLVLIGFFFAASVYPLFPTYLRFSSHDYTVSLARYFYILPILLGALVLAERADRLKIILWIFICLCVLGALSLFYQIATGPVDWFSEPSIRDGLTRYASILGSLTIMGVAGGVALPAVLLLPAPRLLRRVLLIIIVTGMLFTLQKAAIANILIVAGVAAAVQLIRGRLLQVSGLLALSCLALSGAWYFEIDYVVRPIDNILRLNEDGYSDVPLMQSIIDRIWLLPSKLFDLYGLKGLVFGVGMVAGGGVLGFEEMPMAHNVLFDFLFIGGIPYLLAFLMLVGVAGCRLLAASHGSNRDARVHAAATASLGMLVVNFPFSSGIQYQPVIGGILYCLVVYGVLLRPGSAVTTVTPIYTKSTNATGYLIKTNHND